MVDRALAGSDKVPLSARFVTAVCPCAPSYWSIATIRWFNCMLPSVLLFMSIISLTLRGNELTNSPGCGLPPFSGDDCDTPLGFIFGMIIVVCTALFYGCMIGSAYWKAKELSNANEADAIDVLICFHINCATLDNKTFAMYCLFVCMIAGGVCYYLSIQFSVLETMIPTMFLLFTSVFKLLGSVGGNANQITFDMWDNARKTRCATTVRPLHPLASVLTRDVASVLHDEIAGVFKKYSSLEMGSMEQSART